MKNIKTTIHAMGKKSPKSRSLLKAGLLAGVLVLSGCTLEGDKTSTTPSNERYYSIELYSGATLVDTWVLNEDDYKYRSDKGTIMIEENGETQVLHGDFVVTNFEAPDFKSAVEKARAKTASRPINHPRSSNP